MDPKFFIGKITLNDIKFHGLLNTSVKVILRTKEIPKYYGIYLSPPYNSELNISNQYSFQFLLGFRNCEIGEIYKKELKT